MNKIVPFLVALLVSVGPFEVSAQDSPPEIAGAKVITVTEAKAAIDRSIVPLDVRRKATFLEGHLPNAKSIVQFIDSKAKQVEVEAFPAPKSTPILIYGHGVDGWSAVYAVEAAVKAGYTEVLWLRTGFRAWEAAGLPIAK